MNTFTLISVFVGVAGLVVGSIQLVLMLIQIHKGKNKVLARKCGDLR